MVREGILNGMYGRKRELCPNWKGDNVGERGLHNWLSVNLPRSNSCQKCGKVGGVQICNISKEYNKETYTRDFKNWWWGCKRCHKLYDYKDKTRKRISEAIKEWHGKRKES